MVLWGPPGCGKTTIARALANETSLRFIQISAVLDGVKRLREVVAEAKAPLTAAAGTLLFVDEIHRWNKAQQDALLPHVESGTLVLVGATTENPSFELNAALRSRLQIVRLEPLAVAQIRELLDRALVDDRGLAGSGLQVEGEVLDLLAKSAGGDARRALTDLDRIASANPNGGNVDVQAAHQALQREDIRHDRDGEDHFNVMSAMIKSLRGSDPNAAVYWLARLLHGGEDPVALARRLVIFASEDVGNADPRGLTVATAAATAVRMTGMPEARIILSQAVTWLACCPKSNASYLAINKALEDVKQHGAIEVPLHLRNAPTEYMKSEGYGDGYRYPHDYPYGVVKQAYLPGRLRGARYYQPTKHGAEKLISDRLAFWRSKLDDPKD